MNEQQYAKATQEIYRAVENGEIGLEESRAALAELDMELEWNMPDDIYGGNEPYGEESYRNHLSNEGGNSWNENPDGCFFCGGDHHSDSCPERY